MTAATRQDWRFDAHTRAELTGLAENCTLVLPLGSTEQHGHHLPVRVDAAVVTHLAERAVELASRTVPVLLLPTLPFGVAAHHLEFGGTVSIGSAAYTELLTDIVTGLAHQGFRRLVLLNGHGGNEAPMQVAASRAVDERGARIAVAAASYWRVAQDVLSDVGFAKPLVPGHAGHFETSLMLAIAPDLVDLSVRPDDGDEPLPLARDDLRGAQLRAPGLWRASDGRTDDARAASGEAGRRILDSMARSIADFIVRFDTAEVSR